MESYTQTQLQRLGELGAQKDRTEEKFASAEERDACFRTLERTLAEAGRQRLVNCVDNVRKPALIRTRERLERYLIEEEGFTQVVTPSVITGDMLDRMTITEDNPLREQVYWIDKNRCLRPMLAPNLYIVMRDLSRAVKKPVRIFEIGSCFRKDSNSAQHLSEFTMLNLVEYSTVKEGEQAGRLEALAHGVMNALGITGYELVKEKSDVYIETLDIEKDGVELASGSFGPHPLDGKWGVFTTWVGLGMGLERAAAIVEGFDGVKRVARSTGYFDGVPLRL